MRVVHRFFAAVTVLISTAAIAPAQTIDDLNLQIHGYATQGFLYTNQNNWNTTNSSDGSPAWTEAVVNLTVQPQSKLRIGVQARYMLLGNFGNTITLDYAQADYQASDLFGFRVGKVKTPVSLFNESQDIDPTQLWVLLPQSIYPISSRSSTLAHYGGVVYGKVSLGERRGKLEYRAFGGERVISSDDALFQALLANGISMPNGLAGPTFGGTLRWIAPIHGLVFGASENSGTASGALTAGSYQGTLSVPQYRQTFYFGRYEHNRFMLAGEYNRTQDLITMAIPAVGSAAAANDLRPFYAMSTYRISDKLSAGLYYSYFLDHKAALTSSRYQKDWALTARYDFSPFLYAKLEQHWMDGTGEGFIASDNPNLQPTTRMSLLKLGVSF